MTSENAANQNPATDDKRFEAGIQVRREVMGDAFVDAALERNAGSDGEALQKHVTETVWGSVWTRDGLAETMLIAPMVDAVPNSVACGPFTTSIRSIS